MRSVHSQVAQGVKGIAKELFRDKKLQVAATWKVFSKAEFDTVLKKNVERYTEYPVVFIRFQKKEDSSNSKNMPMGLSGLMTGEFEFAIRIKDVPEGVSNRDLIIEDGKIYEVSGLHYVMDTFLLIAIKGLT